MSGLGWNVALAAVWATALGELSLANLAVGFVLGYAILWLARGGLAPTRYFRKAWLALEFAGFFALQLLLSSLKVAADILTPAARARPGVIGIPLDARSDGEITLLANLISLTPGSLSLDVSEDRSTLFVHVMFLDDEQAVQREIKQGFERRVLELLR